MIKSLRLVFLCCLVLTACSVQHTDSTQEHAPSDAAYLRSSTENQETETGQRASYQRYTVMGIPRFPSDTQEHLDIVVLKNVGYVCGFSKKLKIPMWTCYRLGEQKLEYERSGEWRSDPRLPKDSPDEHAYRGTGKQRGHMAPAYGMMTRYGSIAMIESFYMANACPMEPRLNQGVWATSENHVARNKSHWANSETEVWVICGPLWEPGLDRLPSGVAVPKHFFKILIRDPLNQQFDEEDAESLAFLFPAQGAGEEQELEDFIVSIDQIEDSGINVMPELEPALEQRLESSRALKRWGRAVWEAD